MTDPDHIRIALVDGDGIDVIGARAADDDRRFDRGPRCCAANVVRHPKRICADQHAITIAWIDDKRRDEISLCRVRIVCTAIGAGGRAFERFGDAIAYVLTGILSHLSMYRGVHVFAVDGRIIDRVNRCETAIPASRTLPIGAERIHQRAVVLGAADDLAAGCALACTAVELHDGQVVVEVFPAGIGIGIRGENVA